jgi:hypothetical protein
VLLITCVGLIAIEFIARGVWTSGTGRLVGDALLVPLALGTYAAVKITSVIKERSDLQAPGVHSV